MKSATRCIQANNREPSVNTHTEFWRHCVLSGGSTPRFAPIPERRNGNIHLNKYFIPSCGDRAHNLSRLQLHFVPLRYDWSML